MESLSLSTPGPSTGDITVLDFESDRERTSIATHANLVDFECTFSEERRVKREQQVLDAISRVRALRQQLHLPLAHGGYSGMRMQI